MKFVELGTVDFDKFVVIVKNIAFPAFEERFGSIWQRKRSIKTERGVRNPMERSRAGSNWSFVKLLRRGGNAGESCVIVLCTGLIFTSCTIEQEVNRELYATM